MALIEVSVIPLGTGTPSVSQYVARAVEVLKAEKNFPSEMKLYSNVLYVQGFPCLMRKQYLQTRHWAGL